MSDKQEELDRVCKSRGLPRVQIGTECEMDGQKGVIVGSNASANLSIVFDGESIVSNCHPHYKMRIFNSSGGLCYESDDLYTKP